MRILELADEPSTRIGRVRIARRRTLCGDRCGAVRILELADEPSTGIGRVGSLAGEPSAGIGVAAVRILELADEPSTGIGRVGSLAGEPSAGIGVVPCESLSSPMNPLQGSGVSERSRCGAVQILELAGEPSAGIGRVGSLAGEPAAGIGVVPCEALSSPMNPLRGSGVSERSRCGAVRILELAGETLCGDRACRIARRRTLCGIGVVPCESLSSPMNPLRGSGVSERSRCGAVRILELAGEPSAGIGHVGSLAGKRSACGDRSVSERSRCGAVRILELAGEPSAGIWRVGSLAGEPCGDRACGSGLAVVPCESLSSLGREEREEGGGRKEEGGRRRREEGGEKGGEGRRQEEEEGGGGRRRAEEGRGGRTLLRVAVFDASHNFGRSGRDPPPLPLFHCKSVWPRMTEYKGIHPFKGRRGMKKGGVRLSPLRAFPNHHLPICRSSELIHTRRSSLSLPSREGSSRTEGGGGRRREEGGGEGRGGEEEEGEGEGEGEGGERERERERERARKRERERERQTQRQSKPTEQHMQQANNTNTP